MKCFIDGNCLCVAKEDFIDIQESDVVFIKLSDEDINKITRLRKGDEYNIHLNELYTLIKSKIVHLTRDEYLQLHNKKLDDKYSSTHDTAKIIFWDDILRYMHIKENIVDTIIMEFKNEFYNGTISEDTVDEFYNKLTKIRQDFENKMTKKGTPKRDGSGKGTRANRGRGGCATTERKGKGRK